MRAALTYIGAFLLSATSLAQTDLNAPAVKQPITLGSEIKRGCSEIMNLPSAGHWEDDRSAALSVILAKADQTEGYLIDAHLGMWLMAEIRWEASSAGSVAKIGYHGCAQSAWAQVTKDIKAKPLTFEQLGDACEFDKAEFLSRLDRWQKTGLSD
jgi:hypothetical protein